MGDPTRGNRVRQIGRGRATDPLRLDGCLIQDLLGPNMTSKTNASQVASGAGTAVVAIPNP